MKDIKYKQNKVCLWSDPIPTLICEVVCLGIERYSPLWELLKLYLL